MIDWHEALGQGLIAAAVVGMFVVPIALLRWVWKLIFGQKKRCPSCAEKIQVKAVKCKHCGELQSLKSIT
jgi:hypothetical protein